MRALIAPLPQNARGVARLGRRERRGQRLRRPFADRRDNRLRTTARRQIDCRHPEPATVISSVARVSVFCDCATHKFLMTARVSQACEVA